MQERSWRISSCLCEEAMLVLLTGNYIEKIFVLNDPE
jgi:hypothetical protein